MALAVAILLALFVLPAPWSYAAVVGGAAVEIAEAAGLVWWSKRRRPAAGADGLLGEEAVVVDARYVRVAGELWRARDLGGHRPGERVRIRAVDGLEVEIE